MYLGFSQMALECRVARLLHSAACVLLCCIQKINLSPWSIGWASSSSHQCSTECGQSISRDTSSASEGERHESDALVHQTAPPKLLPGFCEGTLYSVSKRHHLVLQITHNAFCPCSPFGQGPLPEDIVLMIVNRSDPTFPSSFHTPPMRNVINKRTTIM